jgi:rod shape-determining protein MreD
MMSALVMLIALATCGVLQTHLPAFALLGQAKPPLLLSVVLYYALRRERARMYTSAVLAGLLHDALSPMPFGFSSCAYCVVGACVARYRKVLLTESPITQSFFGGIGAGVATLIVYILLASHSFVEIPPTRLLLRILGTGFYGMLVTPVICLCLWRLDNMLGNIFVAKEVEDATGEIESTT